MPWRLSYLLTLTMNEDLASMSDHCVASIDYWIHATVPTLERFAPIGDQARVSPAPLYDYHRALVTKAIVLNKDSQEAKRGMWWLNNISISKMTSAFNLKDNIYKLPVTSTKPTELKYYSPKVGDLFARTSWDTDATYIHFKTGEYNESHAHQDQGSISIYNGSWLAVTENIHTHSGIQQGTDVHNLIRFSKINNTIVKQSMNSMALAKMEFSDTDNILKIRSDLSKLYDKEKNVNSWIRFLEFDRDKNTISIRDSFQCNSDSIAAIWQLNTPEKPELRGDSVIAGKLILVTKDNNIDISILEWNKIKSDDENWKKEFKNGWKIEIIKRDKIQEFNMVLFVDVKIPIKHIVLSKKYGQGNVWLKSFQNKKSMIRVDIDLPKGMHRISAYIYNSKGQEIWNLHEKIYTGGMQRIDCDLKTSNKNLSYGCFWFVANIDGEKTTCFFTNLIKNNSAF